MKGNRREVTVGAVAIGYGALILALGYSQKTWATVAMIVVVLIAAAILLPLLGATVGSLVLLIIACFVDEFVFPLGRLNIRPEQIAVCVALGVWAWTALSTRRWVDLRPSPIEGLLLAWFALGLLSSLIGAPARGTSIKVLALFGISSAALFVSRRLVEPEQFDQVVRWLLIALALESAYTLGAYYLHVFGPTISLTWNPATQHLNAKGTIWESNVLGAVAGAGAVLWSYLGPRYFKWTWLGVALCLAACLASFARAAWLAVGIVGLLTLVTPLRHRLELRAFGVAAIAGTLLAAAGLIAVERIGVYTQPGNAAGSAITNSTDIIGRLYQFHLVRADIAGHPLRLLIGSGIHSFDERHMLNGVPEHIANLELFILNDTGVIGTALLTAFGLLIVRAVWRQRDDLRVVGLGAMVLVLALTNTSTETLELMITWLLIGILVASIDVAARASRPESARTAPGTA